MANQGLITFPGITQAVAAQFTLSRGIRPSTASIELVPQQQLPNFDGDMIFSFGSTRITFKKCRVDRNSFSRTEQGFIWRLEIFDRRWMWTGNGHISGRYNLRKEDGFIDIDTEKKPRELAKLCLEAMGERGFDTSKMPNDDRPEIEWDYRNPAEALDELCEAVGCEVVLGLNDRVSIHRVGVGRDLPNSPTVFSESLSLDIPELPDSILLVGAPIRFQDRFTLVPVGLDTDGKVKAIDDLTYKPENGWANSDAGFFADIEDEDERRLAVQTVWKWYKIEKLSDGTLKHPYTKKELKKISQCLPLEDGLVQVYVDIDGKTKQQPAIIRGIFEDGQGKGDNTVATDFYPYDFSIDRAAGIVRFSDPVFKRDDDGSLMPAEINLEVAHAMRDNDTDTWIRYTKREDLRGRLGTKPRVVKREDLQQTVWHRYTDATGVVQSSENNVRDVDKDARPYLEGIKAELSVVGSSQRSYRGLMAIDLDGAISQVSWSVGTDSGADTVASYNDQHDKAVPATKDRRALQRLRLERVREREQAEKEINRTRANARRLS